MSSSGNPSSAPVSSSAPSPRKPSSSVTATQASSASAPGSESDAADTEFEPTAEMMVDEYDDERTLDEAEAEAAIEGEDQEEENQ